MKEKGNSVQGIGMKFDEAAELFNEETLKSMAMNDVVGGTGTYLDACPDSGGQMSCTQPSGCSGTGSSGSGSGSGSGSSGGSSGGSGGGSGGTPMGPVQYCA